MNNTGPIFVICMLVLGLAAFLITRRRGMRGLSIFFGIAVVLGTIAFILGHFMGVDLTRLPEKLLEAIGL